MSRTEWILGALLGTLVVIGAVVLLIQMVASPGPATSLPPGAFNAAGTAVGPTPPFTGHTAKVAYAAAQNVANGWQNDAILLSATATWAQGARQSDLLPGKNSWAFTFYSPGSQKTALVAAVDGQVSLVSENQVGQAITLLDTSGWKIDSAAAIEQLMEAGGAQFLQENQITTLVATLTTDSSEGRMAWFLSLFGNHTGDSFTLFLDATSGEIIEIQ